MGHNEGEHEQERDDLSADDSLWSDDVWSEGDEGSLSFEDSGEGSEAESDEPEEAAVESDSSEDEVAPKNTVGDVPLEWYKNEEHIGYDISGRKIKKRDREGRIEAYLRNADDAKNWRKIYDEYNDEEVQITKEEAKIISRMLKGKTPHTNVDPYPDYVDWFEYDDKGHPLSSAPEPKRRFVPSKWEQKKVVKLVRAIRNGWIKFDKPKEEPNFYHLWGDETDTADNKRQGLSYIPAPKPNLPGHEESYNPSVEYIPTQEEIDSYQLMYEEDRPKFIPRRFESLRSVPAYEKALREGFDRCLDLYLCPRTRKKRININPESLKPKLPSKKDLRPYPKTCYLEFKGHSAPVKSLSVEITGQWIASGSSDGTIRIWEVETGRCLKVWNVGGDVRHIAWNPAPDRPILAAIVDHDLLLLNVEVGSEEVQMKSKELLRIDESAPEDDADDKKPAVRWVKNEKLDGITLIHHKAVSNVDWHFKGDYFTTVVPSGDTRAVLLHQLSKKHSHHPFSKLPGLPVAAAFHPSQKMFFVATKKFVQVYDLQKAQLVKKLESGLREISSISIHPGGDNVIVGSKDGKLCWFDTDLSTRPYKTLKTHSKDITSVTFHRKYPLFASSSEDCSVYVFHGMVYSDLNQNPLIVPLEILRGHSSSDGRGVLDCKFHPKQPWLFTAGADSVIRLYCD
ncbi:ribosome biogenesis protein BOP1 homolog [Phragmites australis]|uniref:ribosome biogenesis protein BOP1 homolog n=1 Tax=Phragmites australis TaxID=29695 RepID=UPI002D768F75|nr:ribosome biogenesis protein BOP1 homolog [Phragmites australis]